MEVPNNDDAQNINNLPVLATKETARLREDYPSIEYLEAGKVASWLVERQDQLLMRAKTGRAEMNISKLITLAATAVGAVCYASSPLAPIGAMIAGAGYIWAVGRDLNDSHNFAPIPFVRGNFFEFLTAMGDSEARDEWFANKNDISDLVKHLELFERYEFVMLREFNSQLSDYLTGVESGKRFYAYRWLLDRYADYQGNLPNKASLDQHLSTVAVDPRVNYQVVQVIQSHATSIPQQLRTFEYKEREPIALPEKPTVDLIGQMSSNVGNNTKLNAIDAKAVPVAFNQPPNFQELLKLPLNQRATAIIDALKRSGFDLAKCIQDQITVIAGNQRGGKGTLMAILAILSKALEPQTKTHYFTAGDDIYPFKCDRLVCRLNFPKLKGDKADEKVAIELYNYLQEMDNATQGEYKDIILVIDEAVALSGYLDDKQKQWIIRFLFTRANKKGAQTFIVLHGKNLTSWVGSKNTDGFADTFKSGATFVGCEATSLKLSPLKSISVATGRYFIAEPDSFEKAVSNGEVGVIPDWMKTEINPVTGQPDPARTLLNFFPELLEEFPQVDIHLQVEGKLSDAIANLENSFNLDANQISSSLEVKPISDSYLSSNACSIYSWLKEKRPKQWVKFKGKDNRDMSFVNFLSDIKVTAELRDNVVQELVTAEKIDLTPDGDYLKVL